jgi:hypothetical protein
VSPSVLPCCLEQTRRGIAPGRQQAPSTQIQQIKPRLAIPQWNHVSQPHTGPTAPPLDSQAATSFAWLANHIPLDVSTWIPEAGCRRNPVCLTWNLGRLPSPSWPSQNHPTNHQNDSLKEVGERDPSSCRSFSKLCIATELETTQGRLAHPHLVQADTKPINTLCRKLKRAYGWVQDILCRKLQYAYGGVQESRCVQSYRMRIAESKTHVV